MNDRTTNRLLLPLWLVQCAVLAALGLIVDDGLLAGVLVGAPIVGVSIGALRRLDRKTAIGLPAIFLLAVMARWIIAPGVHYLVYSKTPGLFAPDEIDYNIHARLLAAYFGGFLPHWPSDISNISLVWGSAVFYYLFGQPVPVLVKMLNGIAGSWNAVLAALFAVRVFDARTARYAGVLAALLPSLALWSSLQLKDNPALLGVELSLYCLLLLRERFAVWKLALMLVGLLLVGTNRPYELAFVFLGILGSSVVDLRRNTARNLALFFLLAVVAMLLINQLDVFAQFKKEDESTFERLNSMRSGYLDAGSAVDSSVVDTSTPLGMLLWLPIGIVYFFLAPIPFTGRTTIALATSPEMVFWYMLLPNAVRGLRRVLRAERLAELTPILLYGLSATVGWSTVIGNVGSMFRYRAQVLFVTIVVIAVDRVARKREAERRAAARFELPPALKQRLADRTDSTAAPVPRARAEVDA